MKRTVYAPEHEAFRETIRTFIAKQVTPNYPEWENANQVPRELFNQLAELGATSFDIPEEFGGAGPTSFKIPSCHPRGNSSCSSKFRTLRSEHRHRAAVPAAPCRRRAEAAVASRRGERRDHALHRHDRAGNRIGSGRHQDHGAPVRRRHPLHPQRCQDLHHRCPATRNSAS